MTRISARVQEKAGVVIVVGTAAFAAALWVYWLLSLLMANDASGLIGADLDMFRAAGQLADRGHWTLLYDPAAFAQVHEQMSGVATPVGGAIFAYPPPTAMAFSLLVDLSRAQILWLWYGGAVVTISASLFLLRAPVLVAIYLGSSIPIYAMFRLGQTTWLAIAILTTAVVLLKAGKPLAAGIILGLLVFKPQMLIGVLLWSAIDKRARTVGVAAIGTSMTVVLATVAAFPTAWYAYLVRLGDVLAPAGLYSSFDYSFLAFVRGISPGSGLALIALLGTVLAAVAYWMLGFFRSIPGDDRAVGLAGAVVLTLLVSPRMIVYDWGIVIVAAPVLWSYLHEKHRPELLLVAGFMGIGAIGGYLTSAGPGFHFNIAYPFLALAAAVLARAVRTDQSDRPAPNC